MNKQLRGGFYLALAALIWGMAFSAQSEGGKYMGPFAFTAARSLITFAALGLFTLVTSRGKGARESAPPRAYIKVGVPLGVLMFLATALQQIGLAHTSVAKSGFITALYIVIVPLLGLIIFRRRVAPMVWVGVALSVVGLALLCLKEDLSVGYGEPDHPCLRVGVCRTYRGCGPPCRRFERPAALLCTVRRGGRTGAGGGAVH